jgi:hypothetical protein
MFQTESGYRFEIAGRGIKYESGKFYVQIKWSDIVEQLSTVFWKWFKHARISIPSIPSHNPSTKHFQPPISPDIFISFQMDFPDMFLSPQMDFPDMDFPDMDFPEMFLSPQMNFQDMDFPDPFMSQMNSPDIIFPFEDLDDVAILGW